jgi:hypothetical protein
MGGLFSTPPPFVQRLVCLLTWAIALGLGLPHLFDEARHDSTEIGLVWLRRFLPRGVDLAELFRYRLLIGTVVWFCVYASSCLALRKLGGRMLKDIRGFPLFSYMVSFQHAVTLSCLVAGAYAVAPGHRIDVNAPFVGDPPSWLLEQVLCACAGYLLKDFYIFEVCAPAAV